MPKLNQDTKNGDNLELEIKFLVSSDDVPKLREKIVGLPGILYEGRLYEKTTMLDNKERALDKKDARLRIRQISEEKNGKNPKIEFSYKKRLKADGGIKKEEEIEISFAADINSFFQILNKMGYEITNSYERYRETYKTKETKITLDEFPFGYVLEIEGDENDINEACGFLKLDMEKSYALSCDDAYADLCEKENKKPKNHILFDDADMPAIPRPRQRGGGCSL